MVMVCGTIKVEKKKKIWHNDELPLIEPAALPSIICPAGDYLQLTQGKRRGLRDMGINLIGIILFRFRFHDINQFTTLCKA